MSDFDPVNNGVAGLDRPPDERVAVVGDRYEFKTELIGESVEVMDVTEDHVVARFSRFVGSVRGNPEWKTIPLAEFDRITKQAISEGATFTPAK